jgi:hypothetical protein
MSDDARKGFGCCFIALMVALALCILFSAELNRMVAELFR